MRGQNVAAAVAAIAMIGAACGDGAADTTTTTAEVVTTTAAPATTAAPPTTTTAPTTEEPATTDEATADGLPPPTAPQNLTVRPAGGSQEVLVTWDPLPDDQEVVQYVAFFSEQPGGDKTPRLTVVVGMDVFVFGDRIGFIDHPIANLEGQSCYIVYGVNQPQEFGAPSEEACFEAG